MSGNVSVQFSVQNDVPRGTEVNKCTVQWFPNYYQILLDDGPCGRNM
jgi:hypothetical protein